MISVLMLSGVQMLMLGVIGEYLWRNYHESRKLPNFVIEHVDDGGGAPASGTGGAAAAPGATRAR